MTVFKRQCNMTECSGIHTGNFKNIKEITIHTPDLLYPKRICIQVSGRIVKRYEYSKVSSIYSFCLDDDYKPDIFYSIDIGWEKEVVNGSYIDRVSQYDKTCIINIEIDAEEKLFLLEE